MEEEKEPSKRLNESQWIVASSLWELGEVTLKDLSEKFGISEAALSQGLKRRGIKRGSKAYLASKEIELRIKEEKEKMVEDIFIFKKRFLKYGEFLMTLTMNEITEAKKSGGKLVSKKPEIDTIFAATKVYKTIRNDMFHLYDLYNTENTGEEQEQFNFGVYSEKEIDQLREAQELLDAEMSANNDSNMDSLDFDDEDDDEDDGNV
jgi:hypothetical protein